MRVFFNEDAFHFWMTRFDSKIDIDKTVLQNFILQYKNTNITDFVLNINFSTSVTQTEVFDTFIKKYNKTQENGEPVNYKNDYPSLIYKLYKDNIDPYQVFIDTLKNININPWLSIRMNDVHHVQNGTHLWKAEEIEKFPDRWIANYRKCDFYFDKCRNYMLEEVRKDYLNYIKEQLERYDVYGIELDFSREPYCFPYGFQDEGRKIITEFIREVRKTVNQISLTRKKEIKLSIICQANPQTAYNNGFDICEIAQYGLVDFVIISPRWATINTNMPIEIWKKLLPSNVLLGCNQQLLVKSNIYDKDVFASYDMDFGQAVANISRGADFIYLYNHFDTVERRVLNAPHDTSFREPKLLNEVLNNIGDYNLMLLKPRRIPITFDDFSNGYEKQVSIMPYIRNGIMSIEIPTGPITEKNEVYFNIKTKRKINPKRLEVFSNTKKAEYCFENFADKNIIDGNVYSFRLKYSTKINTFIEIITHGLLEIEYAEIYCKGI